MGKFDNNLRTHCPISFALDFIGDKWSLLILRDLIFKGKNRYKDFLEAGEKISTNILASRLVQLEDFGLIEKLDDPDNGRQYIYLPTERGLDLIPVMIELVRWSSTHDPKTAAPKEFIAQLKSSPEKLATEIRKNVIRHSKKISTGSTKY